MGTRLDGEDGQARARQPRVGGVVPMGRDRGMRRAAPAPRLVSNSSPDGRVLPATPTDSVGRSVGDDAGVIKGDAGVIKDDPGVVKDDAGIVKDDG